MKHREIQNLKILLNSDKTFSAGVEILKQLDQNDYEVFYNSIDFIVYNGLFTTKEENFKAIPYNKGTAGGLLHLPKNVKDLSRYNLGIL